MGKGTNTIERMVQDLNEKGIHDFCVDYLSLDGSKSPTDLRFIAKQLGRCPFEDEQGLAAWGAVFFSKEMTSRLYAAAQARDPRSKTLLEMMMGENGLAEATHAEEADRRYHALIKMILPKTYDSSSSSSKRGGRKHAQKFKLADGKKIDARSLRKHLLRAVNKEEGANRVIDGITEYLALGQQSLDRVLTGVAGGNGGDGDEDGDGGGEGDPSHGSSSQSRLKRKTRDTINTATETGEPSSHRPVSKSRAERHLLDQLLQQEEGQHHDGDGNYSPPQPQPPNPSLNAEASAGLASLSPEERGAAKVVLELKQAAHLLMPSRPPQHVELDLSTRWILYDNGIDFVNHARDLGAKCTFFDVSDEGDSRGRDIRAGTRAHTRLETVRANRIVSFQSQVDPTRWLCFDAFDLREWIRRALAVDEKGGDLKAEYARTMNEKEGGGGRGRGRSRSQRDRNHLTFPGTDQVIRVEDVQRVQDWIEAAEALQRVLESVDDGQRLAIESAAAQLVPSKSVDAESSWARFLGRKLYNVLTSKFTLGIRQAVYGAEWLVGWVPRILALSLFVSVVRTLMCLTAKFYLFNSIAPGIGTGTFVATELRNSLDWIVAQMGADAARSIWDKLLTSSTSTSPSLTTSVVVAVLSWISEKIGMSAPVRALTSWRKNRAAIAPDLLATRDGKSDDGDDDDAGEIEVIQSEGGGGRGDDELSMKITKTQRRRRRRRAAAAAGLAVLILGGGSAVAVATAAAGGMETGMGALAAFYQRVSPAMSQEIFGIFGMDHVKKWALNFAEQMPLIRGWSAVSSHHHADMGGASKMWDAAESTAARVSFVTELVSKYVCRLFRESAERSCTQLFASISRTSAALFLVSSIADVLYNLGVLAVYGLARGHSFLRMPCLVNLSSLYARHDLTREVTASEMVPSTGKASMYLSGEDAVDTNVGADEDGETLGETLGELVHGLPEAAAAEADLVRGYEGARIAAPRMKHLDRVARRYGGKLPTSRGEVLNAREKDLDEREIRRLRSRDGNIFHADPFLDPAISQQDRERLLEIFKRATIQEGLEKLQVVERDLRQSERSLQNRKAILQMLLSSQVTRQDIDIDLLHDHLVEMTEKQRTYVEDMAHEKAVPAATKLWRLFTIGGDQIGTYMRTVMRVQDPEVTRDIARNLLEISNIQREVDMKERVAAGVREGYARMVTDFESSHQGFEEYQKMSSFPKWLERMKIKTQSISWRKLIAGGEEGDEE